MAWKGLTLTRDGQSVLNNAQVSDRMNIKSIAIGDGAAPADFRNLKGLVNKLHEITDLKIEMVDGQCTLTADLPQVNYDYTFREIGVIVTTDDGEKLYVYDNCGADAQRIISSTGVETTKKRIRLFLEISDVANITVSTPSILYVAYDEFEEKMDRIDASINDKVGKEPGKGLSANDYTDQEKAKLQGIEEGANNYTHPATHPADMIDQDATHRFVTDLEKQVWGGAYAQATAYADQQIADLINGAPETLNTLGEIAKAMQDNADVVAALDRSIGQKANIGHIHDDRYYTETEVDNKLTEKAARSHKHNWDEIGGKPSTYTPSGHTHDDRYYTESEIDDKLLNVVKTKGYIVQTAYSSANAASVRFEHGLGQKKILATIAQVYDSSGIRTFPYYLTASSSNSEVQVTAFSPSQWTPANSTITVEVSIFYI